MSHNEIQNPLEIAAFDFDGTLLKTDSMRAFLIETYGVWPLIKLLSRSPSLAAGMMSQSTRGAQRWEVIGPIIGPISAEDLRAKAQNFFHKHGLSLLRPKALKAWQTHRSQNRRCAIVSGSLRPILEPFAQHLGADCLICTEIAYKDQGLIALSENCVGPEKLRRIKVHYGDQVKIHSAYGDTRGDYEMLTAAQFPYYRRF